ncbi:PLDc N-terminal domain-containing protein [Streptomyces sp. NPDC059176]|uniref:SHOCT domain-containing protein n=1 Tax=unclassified Streptomyces TaxID=2593676 RepID=UPI003680CF82
MGGTVYLAYDYPVLGAFWTVMWIFLWVMWLILLFRVIMDLFRDHEMNGWAKAAWLLFVLIVPFLGVLVYVIVRGRDMGKREVQQAREQQEAFNDYIRQTAKGSGTTDELARLSELKAKGDLSDEEFQQAKQKLLR